MGWIDGCKGNGGRMPKIIGLTLMIAGVILLLVSVPCWMWASILGILMISVGFLIWRFA